jgi:predicted DNA-binding helix-hairpin-helix protein
VEVNRADSAVLLRIPGIGVRSAQRIVRARKMAALGFDDLKKLGVVLKRARYFLTAKGEHIDECTADAAILRQRLTERPVRPKARQLSLFPENDGNSAVTGEL